MEINLYQKNRWNDIFEFIEIWYNRKRRHSALDYKTIEEFGNRKIILKMLLN
jgi:transposase InsO family protein